MALQSVQNSDGCCATSWNKDKLLKNVLPASVGLTVALQLSPRLKQQFGVLSFSLQWVMLTVVMFNSWQEGQSCPMSNSSLLMQSLSKSLFESSQFNPELTLPSSEQSPPSKQHVNESRSSLQMALLMSVCGVHLDRHAFAIELSSSEPDCPPEQNT